MTFTDNVICFLQLSVYNSHRPTNQPTCLMMKIDPGTWVSTPHEIVVTPLLHAQCHSLQCFFKRSFFMVTRWSLFKVTQQSLFRCIKCAVSLLQFAVSLLSCVNAV